MNRKIINLCSGNKPISIEERRLLINKVFEKYRSLGGNYELDKFNFSSRQYEDLKSIFEFELISNLKNQIEFRKDHQEVNRLKELIPGTRFLKDFFQSKELVSEHRSIYLDMTCVFFCKCTFNEYKQQHPEIFPDVKEQIALVLNFVDRNEKTARVIKDKLENRIKCSIIMNECNTPISHNYLISETYSIYPNSIKIIVLSKEFLQEENTLIDYFKFIERNPQEYWGSTIHLLLPFPEESEEYKLLSLDGHIELIKYWNDKLMNYEIQLANLKTPEGFSIELKRNETIVEQQIEDTKQALSFFSLFITTLNNRRTVLKLNDIDKIEDYKHLKEFTRRFETPKAKYLYGIASKIIVPSNNAPDNPEFPPKPFYEPKFPASSIVEKRILNRQLYFINEVDNPTGTHKDRFAWEVIVYCRKLMKKRIRIPDFSLISSGSAAIAIQHLFNLYKIPAKLKVLVDVGIEFRIEEYLKKIGCVVIKHQLEYEYLDSEKILLYTQNKGGIDITYREILDPTYVHYYDWYSYEILNGGFDYFLIPYGTGDLFSNILTVYKNEYLHKLKNEKPDPRMLFDFNLSYKPCFIGISTMDEKSLMDKLYSSYKPAQSQHRKLMYDLMNKFKCICNNSKIVDHIDESYVKEAIKIASDYDIVAEPSGLAGLAFFLKESSNLPETSKIGIINTGKTKSWEDLKEFYTKHKIKLKNIEANV